jgi:hypothetical protein
MIKPHIEHQRELLEDLLDLTASVAARAEARIEAKSKEIVTDPKIKFAWDTKKTCQEILGDLGEADIVFYDTMFLPHVVDPEDWTVYAVVVYTEDPEELFVGNYSEEQATADFLALMHTVVKIGV